MSTHASPPSVRPANPNFSSGPCAKRPGWTAAALAAVLEWLSYASRSFEGTLT